MSVVNVQPHLVGIGRSNTGAVIPSAVLDSGPGVSLVLTTSAVAKAIGDVNPASDGSCSLQLTTEPPKDTQAELCIALNHPAYTKVGDVTLRVPFLHSIYPVMAYGTPTPTAHPQTNTTGGDTRDLPHGSN